MGYNLILTIAAFVLLGSLLLSTQNLISYNEQDSVENEYILAAYGAAQSVIDEAVTKAFDEASVSAGIADTGGLTPAGYLGRDGSAEAIPAVDTMITSAPFSSAYPGYRSSVLFDDVDDYDGYVRLIRAARSYEGDTVHVRVGYALAENPDLPAASIRTWCKRMTVTVTGRYLPRPITLTYGFTY